MFLFVCLFACLLVLFAFDEILSYSLGCPGTLYVEQAGPGPSASASGMLKLEIFYYCLSLKCSFTQTDLLKLLVILLSARGTYVCQYTQLW